MKRMMLLGLALVAGCASDEALFAEYERPCPVETAPRSVPELAMATVVVPAGGAVPELAVATVAGPELPGFEQAVFFAYRSAELDALAVATLDAVIAVLDEHPEAHLFLRAQTDWRGSDAVNAALAERRLDSVRTALRDAGVEPVRLRGVGIGERETVETRDPLVMDAARRVDIEFVDANGRPLPIRLAAGGRAG